MNQVSRNIALWLVVALMALLAIRLMRPGAIGWLFAVTAFCVLLGTVAESSTKDAIGDKAVHGLADTWVGVLAAIDAILLGKTSDVPDL